MSLETSRIDPRRRAQWPPRTRPSAHDFPATHCYLLDADDDLAAAFDLRMRLAARQVVTAMVFEVAVGECDLTSWFDAVGNGPGLLLLDGMIAIDARVGDRTATELVGSGDLLMPHGQTAEHLLEYLASWRALLPARLAVLDDSFIERTCPWPQITQELLHRAGRRAADLDVLRAIASQPRLEVRLVLVLWHFARRWGRVEHHGIRLCLPLTHRLLGQIMGAERPSVSHALARLNRAGLVTGTADDFHLHGTVEEHIAALVERAGSSDGAGQAHALHEPLERADAS